MARLSPLEPASTDGCPPPPGFPPFAVAVPPPLESSEPPSRLPPPPVVGPPATPPTPPTPAPPASVALPPADVKVEPHAPVNNKEAQMLSDRRARLAMPKEVLASTSLKYQLPLAITTGPAPAPFPPRGRPAALSRRWTADRGTPARNWRNPRRIRRALSSNGEIHSARRSGWREPDTEHDEPLCADAPGTSRRSARASSDRSGSHRSPSGAQDVEAEKAVAFMPLAPFEDPRVLDVERDGWRAAWDARERGN